MTVTINIIQDLATPHNNVLIKELVSRDDVQVKLWYLQPLDPVRYQWSSDISQEYSPASFYGKRLNFSFIKYCLTHRNERFIIVGWTNINTRFLHLLFFILRQPYNHWTDLPNPKPGGDSIINQILRWIAYKILRFSRCKVFGVGKITLEWFRTRRFPEEVLVNLPIFVAVDEDIPAYRAQRAELFDRYSVPDSGFLLSAGSRLIFEKGYDLLIQSIADLTPELRNQLKLVIVGSGVESEALNKQISGLELTSAIQIEKWLDINDFKALIASSDIFLHPSRFDSFGGTILGMALGVPVIGSTGAGAAVDRINNGENGFLYQPTDTQQLAMYITRLLNDAELRRHIGEAARKTALQWQPSCGVDILLQNSI